MSQPSNSCSAASLRRKIMENFLPQIYGKIKVLKLLPKARLPSQERPSRCIGPAGLALLEAIWRCWCSAAPRLGGPEPTGNKTNSCWCICAPSIVSPEQTGTEWAAGKQGSYLTFTCFLTERETHSFWLPSPLLLLCLSSQNLQTYLAKYSSTTASPEMHTRTCHSLLSLSYYLGFLFVFLMFPDFIIHTVCLGEVGGRMTTIALALGR